MERTLEPYADNATGEILNPSEMDRWQWADAIKARWQDAVTSIIDVGQMLIQAKESLPHGEFGPMCEDLPWSSSTSRRLMIIAAHPVVSNRAHGHDLPPHWRTLYELAQLPEETVEHGIEDGTITPEMSRAKAKRWRYSLENHDNGDESLDDGLYQIEDATIVVGDAREMDPSQFPHKYRVITADPPWQYRATTGRGIAEDVYDVLTIDDLLGMPVARLAADDCILMLWTTWPMLPDAMRLVPAWGFEYKTGWPWVKTYQKSGGIYYGVGRWIRGASEPILMGVRGDVSPSKEMKNYIGLLSPNLEHSRKPASVHQMAETLPGPYLELFGRRGRPGWTVFGNQVQRVLC